MKLASVLVSLVTIPAALASTACGSGDGSGKPTTGAAEENPCGLHTQFAGDDNCIPAPDKAVGLQLHVGPPDYDNPGDQWVMPPGKEIDQCFHLYAPNDEDIYYFKQQYRMRSGSHHVILMMSSDTTGPEVWSTCKTSLAQAIGGSQHLVEDYPPGGKVAPEDEGLGRAVAKGQPFDLWLHTFNATDQPTLRELWINLLYIDKNDVKTNLGMLGGLSFMSVPPHQSATVGGSCDASSALGVADPNNVRVVSLFGHAHTHTVRFAVENQHPDGSSDLVYDSYERAEGPQYIYNSVEKNPVPDPTLQHTGAMSGDLIMHTGDSLKYTCDIVNDLNITLTFKEEVYTGEMCNLFGSVAGAGFPCSGIRLN